MGIAKVLRERLITEGHIAHDFMLFTAVGEPLRTTYLPYNRWTEVLATLPARRRKPYSSRHSCLDQGSKASGREEDQS